MKKQVLVLMILMVIVSIYIMGTIEVYAESNIEVEILPSVDYQSDYLGKVALVVVGYLILPSVVVLGVLYTIYVIIRGITKKKPKEQKKEGNQEQGEKEVDGKKK